MGGLEKEKHSLLTCHFIATEDDGKVIAELELFLRPDDGTYKVNGQAMNVNRIDLKIHDTMAITYKEGGSKLYKWLQKLTDDGKIKAIVVGHGIYGDVDWITYHLMSIGSWEKFTSYRKLDTSAVCQFLRSCGLFPDNVSGSLESLAKFFKISVNENDLHNAKYDAQITLQVFLALRKFLLDKCDPICLTCQENQRVESTVLDGWEYSYDLLMDDARYKDNFKIPNGTENIKQIQQDWLDKFRTKNDGHGDKDDE